MEKTKIEKIWQIHEEDVSFDAPLVYQRFSADIKPDVFIALKNPGRLRAIAFLVETTMKRDVTGYNTFKDISIEFFPADISSQKLFLLVTLVNKDHENIFSTLCEDLIYEVAEVGDSAVIVNDVLERLSAWQLLFEKSSRKGLSDELQRALYGECYFMRNYIKESRNFSACLDAWKGPERAVQDFQYGNWAVEVKTTQGKNHQKIHISSERQLDTSFVPFIYLYHLSLEVRAHHGETLNEVIDNLSVLLSENPRALSVFRLKLLEYGYFDRHKTLYKETGYSIRNLNIYRITDDFPRITEQDLSPEIGDVRYSLILPANPSWYLTEKELFEKLN